ncbi:hypothetical protein OESDEN_03120 [Oesophagostomum dentatum]|uniref:G-protein coupled receptors family 1 profile domain-containing protein n=1 Tax=Oesophagostomum dentatum TaxID=61180 RepID=A0A0B1TI01_OESDE|nr:hypothetical protein OESDEN_03120 [Oesophagostomum dentatum]
MISALDRFFCVMFPIKYLKAKIQYAICLMFAPYAIALLPIILSIVGSYYYRVKNQPATCNLTEALTSYNFSMLRLIRVVLTLASVVVYVPITITMYKSIRDHHKLTNYAGGRNERKLLRMTLTIALITSNTICMFTVPDIILLVYPSYSSNIFYLMNLNK